MTENEYKKCVTVAELRTALAELPDDMPVGKWDGDYGMMLMGADGAPTTVYDQERNDRWSIYGGYDEDENYPTMQMLVL
jgi:hypothetical protein